MIRTYLKIEDYKKYIHYKDRNATFVKANLSLLDDDRFELLSDRERWHLITLVMLATKYENAIPYDPFFIQRIARTESPIQIEKLVRLGFIKTTNPYIPVKKLSALDEEARSLLPPAPTDLSGEEAMVAPEHIQNDGPEVIDLALEKAARKKKEQKQDPLANHPVLRENYPAICRWLEEAHPSIPAPQSGTSQEKAWKSALRDLVKLDGFKEEQVVETLKWLFTEEYRGGGFSWCSNTQSLVGLRRKKKGETATKFHKIFEARRKARPRSTDTYVGDNQIGF